MQYPLYYTFHRETNISVKELTEVVDFSSSRLKIQNLGYLTTDKQYEKYKHKYMTMLLVYSQGVMLQKVSPVQDRKPLSNVISSGLYICLEEIWSGNDSLSHHNSSLILGWETGIDGCRCAKIWFHS